MNDDSAKRASTFYKRVLIEFLHCSLCGSPLETRHVMISDLRLANQDFIHCRKFISHIFALKIHKILFIILHHIHLNEIYGK